MKTICLINFLSSAFVIACNFELSDIPYFNGVFHNAYFTSLAGMKLLLKGLS
ncbi:hypothetical protein [Pedobacter sp. D749]|uniref:hypothetical protein n=1 Tax=Pedobacter sp. D749 TaxID=2856523 RepID=UPI001C587E4E|nr:hypothetical protein [Pedobacter sp. D749]QXU42688.1 hypothetical protein KYH19_03560 [Pedobacter sp. D749]